MTKYAEFSLEVEMRALDVVKIMATVENLEYGHYNCLILVEQK